MRTILVTGSDTGVGKTHATAALARWLARDGAHAQIVKVVETGRTPGDPEGDAERARRLAGGMTPAVGSGSVSASAGPGMGRIEAYTLETFAAPLAPPAAAAAEGRVVSFSALAEAVRGLPDCDWRILESAGGIASPIDDEARDWVDFAPAAGVDALVVVIADRLGAISQARLAHARACQAGLPCGVWLNAVTPPDAAVAAATRAGLRSAGLEVWAEQGFGEIVLRGCRFPAAEIAGARPRPAPPAEAESLPGSWHDRLRSGLDVRDREHLRRTLRVTLGDGGTLNLSDNDYLALARDPAVAAAVAAAAAAHGTSASASPLVTGWRDPHARLAARLAAWHGFGSGLLWSSGYAANAAVLGGLPAAGDLVLADRLIHHSMIAGLLRSGARLQRYEHLALDRLERMLAPSAGRRSVFVVTESVFSMDGDYPDLRRMAELKRIFGFCWIVDEAHALGWYGQEGAGLVRAAGVEREVDVLVGTLGKTLAAGGAYTLFHDELLRDHLVNTAGEFIYSTALPPTTVAAADAALERVRELAAGQPQWHALSRGFRRRLAEDGWAAPEGESPIVPVQLDHPGAALALGDALRREGILAAAIRPPTVPAGTSRLRFSLKRNVAPESLERVLAVMADWRAKR
ncbi:MAG TPA: aminotransferase class I/II-fold pyridoxal phosphate-dependent enzyme [Opitutaceae bacterium]|nr:aminotransferase class I/II-fold pyridoxal phosphate-dependent enzyme [Opitutaceae bacterium]